MAMAVASSAVSAVAAIAGLIPLSPPRLSVSVSVSVSSLKLGLVRSVAFQQQQQQQQLLLIHPLNFKTKSTTTTLSTFFTCPYRPSSFSADAALHLKHQQFQLDEEFQREREREGEGEGERLEDAREAAAPSEPNVKIIIEEEVVEEEKLVAAVTSQEEDDNKKENEKDPPKIKLRLSVKERKDLASFAHSLGKNLKSQQVGKSGVTPSVATSFLETLEANELLKLKIHGSCPGELIDVIKQLEEATGSVAVDQIGRTVILYRPSLSKMKKREAASSRKTKEYPMAFKMQKKAQAPRVSGDGRHQLHRS